MSAPRVRSATFTSKLVPALAVDQRITIKEAKKIASTYQRSGTTDAKQTPKLRNDMEVLVAGSRPDVFVGKTARSILQTALDGPILF